MHNKTNAQSPFAVQPSRQTTTRQHRQGFKVDEVRVLTVYVIGNSYAKVQLECEVGVHALPEVAVGAITAISIGCALRARFT
jgi:hypothetical protein